MSGRSHPSIGRERVFDAVLSPRLDSSAMQLAGGAFVLALIMLVIGVPADPAQCRDDCQGLRMAFAAAKHVAVVERFTLGSAYPLTVGVTYLAALVFSVLMAAIVAFTKFERLNWSAFTGSRKAQLLRFAAYALWFAHLLYAPAYDGPTRANYIVHAVQNNLPVLAFWAVAMFAASALILVALLIDLLLLTSHRGERQ